MKLACVQIGVAYGDPRANADRAIRELSTLADSAVDLAVFPEAFLTGYCAATGEEARRIAISRDHPSISALKDACQTLGICAIVGFAERHGDSIYNTAVLLEPGALPRFYRKTHLPELGLDKHVTAGDDLPVFDTRFGRVGILICFDQRQPEAARVLALKGAELIALPTNWPEGAENSAEIMCVARAAENRVFYAACNRVGVENGFRFIGRSKIIDPSGRILAAAEDGESTIFGEFDLAEAREKRAVVRPGEYEWTVFESRRPELYDVLGEPSKVR